MPAPAPFVSSRLLVVTDLDGTLVRTGPEHMEALAGGLSSYHRSVRSAPANLAVLGLLLGHVAAGDTVVALTARDQRWARATRTWLTRMAPGLAGVPLRMRRFGDERPDDVMKRDALARIVREFGPVDVFVDDHPANVRLARQLGVPRVLRVPGFAENQRLLDGFRAR